LPPFGEERTPLSCPHYFDALVASGQSQVELGTKKL
jgi:hypothetical protein